MSFYLTRDASKRRRTETNTIVEANNIHDVTGSPAVESTSELAISENDNNTVVNVFIEDILQVMFDNREILKAKDLLNFRLVNRCWRNAATSVLLKRNMCEIALDFKEFVLDEDGNAVAPAEPLRMSQYGKKRTNCIDKFFNAHYGRTKSFLADLSQLISTSPKFPSTSIRFCMGGSLGFGSVSYNITKFCSRKKEQYEKDLLNFYSLYGKKIRTLSLSSGISEESIPDLLHVYMPHLTCLDLQKFDSDRYPGSQVGKIKMARSPLLELKEIILGYHSKLWAGTSTDKFVEDLISVSPNLSSIRNVDVSSLEVLIKMGKCHLINDLYFDPPLHQMSTIQSFSKLLTDAILDHNIPSLKLSKLTIVFSDQWKYHDKNDFVIKLFNIILSVTKDTLKYLKLENMDPALKSVVKIFIPPLPYLEFLELDETGSTYSLAPSSQMYFSDVIRRVIKTREVTADDESVYNLDSLHFQNQQESNNNIPPNYFPSLRKVKMNMKKTGSIRPDKLMGFFSLSHLGPDGVTTIPGDTLTTVTNLEWMHFPLYDNKNMSTIFPNVTKLKLYFYSWKDHKNWVWTAFPNLETFEISGRLYCLSKMTADSFFTGISPQLCNQLESNLSFNKVKLQIPKRTQPYIGDCENLKELKISVGEDWQFCSKVADIYGFQKVNHPINIIFWFRYGDFSVKQIQVLIEFFKTRQFNPENKLPTKEAGN